MLLAMTSGVVCAAEWPQWRGPGRDGISVESGLRLEWTAEGPPVLWDREGGGGFSGMSISDGRLFTMWSDGESDYVVALDAESGTDLWQIRVDREN